MREPRWDQKPRKSRADLVGEQGEAYVKRFCRDGAYEVKTDQWTSKSGQLFIEAESFMQTTGRYEPSGIQTSEADYWAFVIGGQPGESRPGDVILVRPRSKIERLCTGRTLVEANVGGLNPTRGYFLPLSEFLPFRIAIMPPRGSLVRLGTIDLPKLKGDQLRTGWQLRDMDGTPVGVGLFVGPTYATEWAKSRGWEVLE